MLFYRNDCTDPQHNIRFEEEIFDAYAGGEEFFMLWRNEKSVIVGSNQVIENEVDLVFARAHEIPIIRRSTGGGAVYHDLGNVNYTVISERAGEFGNFAVFAQPIVAFLQSLGVDARPIGKNDIGIGARKISGGAQRVRPPYILHHGTLLFDVDLDTLALVLTPDPAKLRTKGVKSVRSRVCNISEFLPMGREAFWEAICAYFERDMDFEQGMWNDNDKQGIMDNGGGGMGI
ncbi:MAG: lipoate--protein ligase family protein [Oscillospiraceae bacterium]|nr:lipoate--protein ligase family protein [Oscillospiraceae bacterium]